MSIFKKISEIFKPSGNDRNYWFYVQCDHCKEVLRGRVDMHNHLSIKYGEGKNRDTYYCRKVLIGSNRCYRQIEVEFTFDSNRRFVDRQIKGGVFVDESAFQKNND